MSRARRVASKATLDMEFLGGLWDGMNDQEVIMFDAKPKQDFIAHRKAIEAAGIAIRLVEKLPRRFDSLADQVIRSASSVPANLNEGLGRAGKDRAYHWRVSYASAREVDSHLQTLLDANVIDPERTDQTRRLFDEVRAMTWRLINPKR